VLTALLAISSGLGFPAAECGKCQGRVGREAAAGRLGNRVHLGNEQGRLSELPGEQVHRGAGAGGEVECGESVGLSGGVDVAGGQHVPALVVPHQPGGNDGQPQPAQSLLGGHIRLPEGAYRPLEHGCCCRVAFGNQQRQAIKQQVGRPCGLGRWSSRARRLSDLPDTAAGGQTAGVNRRAAGSSGAASLL
jgi:hypothetical protein